jgi:hypothetical protein
MSSLKKGNLERAGRAYKDKIPQPSSDGWEVGRCWRAGDESWRKMKLRFRSL